MCVLNENIKKIRVLLKDKVLNNVGDFVDCDKERQQIFDLFTRTVETGESNSALLIGPRGVGKTALVNSVISELQENTNFNSDALLVHLNGLIHTDDRLALKSITAQLNLENAIDGKVFGSFAENLAFLLACLRTGQRDVSKSVIFVLDEFDLFCSHHNQTLLYNLLDVAQSVQTPVCVFGITCRLDIIELFEKRVKSRFSHRQIFLFPSLNRNNSNTHDVTQRISRIEQLLSITNNDATIKFPTNFKKHWNKSIKSLVEDRKFKAQMQRLLDIDSNECTLKHILVFVVSSLNEDKTELSVEDFDEQLKYFERDVVVQTLQDLSVLELCLIIAMKHHVEIYDNQPMNFEMILTRYAKFSNANSSIQTVQRPVLLKAFEHIQNMELISPINTSGGRLQKEYQLFKLLITPQQIQDAVKNFQGLPTEVSQWAISSLT